MDISPQESRFIYAYIETGKIADSARRAGYCRDNPSHARIVGYRLMQKVYILDEIRHRRDRLARRVELSQAMMIEALKPILFSNISQLASWDAQTVNLYDSETVDDDSLGAIAEVASSPGKYGGKVKIRLHDKLAAWSTVAKMLGWFERKRPLEELIEALIAIDPELGHALRDAIIERRDLRLGRKLQVADAVDDPKQ